MCFSPPKPKAPPRQPQFVDTQRAGDAERRRRLLAGAVQTRLARTDGVLGRAPSVVRQLLGE